VSLTIDSGQTELAQRSARGVVQLLTLTTYTDRDAETVDTIYYLSRTPVLYPYDGGADQHFRPILRNVSRLRSEMSHLPNVGGRTTARAFEFTISRTSQLADLWAELKDKTLHGATIEFSTLLVDAARYVPGTTTWRDLRDFAGTEHVVRLRAEIDEWGPITESAITFRALSVDPEVPWVEALDLTQVDPRDAGALLPLPYGEAKKVPLVGIQVGWVTSLAVSLDVDTTGIVEVTDSTGLPDAGSFSLLIGSEDVTATKVDATSINISARGASGTMATNHLLGDAVVELIDESIWAVSSASIKSLDRICIANPFNGLLFAMPAGSYSFVSEDANAIPGEVLATIRATQTQLRDVMLDAFASARVLVQPGYSDTGSTSTFFVQPDIANVLTSGGSNAAFITTSGGPPVTTLTADAASAPDNRVSYRYGVGTLPNSCNRWRVVFRGNITGPASLRVFMKVFGFGNIAPLGLVLESTVVDETGLETTSAWSSAVTDLSVYETTSHALQINLSNLGTPDWTDGDAFAVAGNWGIEYETTSGSGNINQVTEAEIAAGSVGFGLRLYADVQGVISPLPTTGTLYAGHDNGTGGTIDPTEAAQWTTSGGAQSVSDITSLTGGVGGAIEWSTLATPGGNISTTHTATDLSGKIVRCLVEMVDVDWLNAGGQFFLLLESAANTWSAFEATNQGALMDGTTTDLIFDLRDAPTLVGSSGLANLAAINKTYWQVLGQTVSQTIRMDTMQVIDPTGASSYSVALGEMLENPADVARHFIAEFCGLGQAAVDDTTFTARETDLAAIKIAGDLRRFGPGFRGVLDGIAFESRANFTERETSTGRVYLMHSASSAYEFGNAVRALSVDAECIEVSRSLAGIGTRWRAVYQFNAFLGNGEQAFGASIRADKDVSDPGTPTTTELAAAETKFGRRNTPPLFLTLHQLETSAEDVLGYYASEGIRDPRIFERTSSLEDVYDLEPGDTVTFVPPLESTAILTRVTGIELATDGRASLLLVEVPAPAGTGFPYTLPITFE
jgi:hypothetical protein